MIDEAASKSDGGLVIALCVWSTSLPEKAKVRGNHAAILFSSSSELGSHFEQAKLRLTKCLGMRYSAPELTSHNQWVSGPSSTAMFELRNQRWQIESSDFSARSLDPRFLAKRNLPSGLSSETFYSATAYLNHQRPVCIHDIYTFIRKQYI